MSYVVFEVTEMTAEEYLEKLRRRNEMSRAYLHRAYDRSYTRHTNIEKRETRLAGVFTAAAISCLSYFAMADAAPERIAQTQTATQQYIKEIPPPSLGHGVAMMAFVVSAFLGGANFMSARESRQNAQAALKNKLALQ